MIEHHRARGRERRAAHPRGPHEQRRADDPLELRDLHAHGRGDVAELRRRGGDRAGAGDGGERGQVARLDAEPALGLDGRDHAATRSSGRRRRAPVPVALDHPAAQPPAIIAASAPPSRTPARQAPARPDRQLERGRRVRPAGRPRAAARARGRRAPPRRRSASGLPPVPRVGRAAPEAAHELVAARREPPAGVARAGPRRRPLWRLTSRTPAACSSAATSRSPSTAR